MGKVFFFVALSGLMATRADSQHKTDIDSVNLRLSSETGVDRWNYLVDQALTFADHDNERALSLIEEAERTALDFGDSSCLVMSQRMRGQILLRLGRHGDAVDIFQRVLPVAHRHRYALEELAVQL